MRDARLVKIFRKFFISSACRMPLVGKNDRVTKKFADITISEGMKLGDLRKAVAGASSKNRARGPFDTEYSTRARPFLLPPALADALKLTDLNRIELRQYVPEAEKKKMDRKQKKGVRFHCGCRKSYSRL